MATRSRSRSQNGIAGYPLPSFVTLTDNGNGNGILHFNPPAGIRGHVHADL